MRRYNRRLYRIARDILHSDTEAEDVMRDAYVRAYEHPEQFVIKNLRRSTGLDTTSLFSLRVRARKSPLYRPAVWSLNRPLPLPNLL